MAIYINLYMHGHKSRASSLGNTNTATTTKNFNQHSLSLQDPWQYN